MMEQIKGIATICVAVAAMAGETALANGTGLPKPVDSRNPHADADIRLSAVEALAKSRDKTVANHLVGLLNDPDRRVRRAASVAIRVLRKN